jgi:hypothetical protein
MEKQKATKTVMMVFSQNPVYNVWYHASIIMTGWFYIYKTLSILILNPIWRELVIHLYNYMTEISSMHLTQFPNKLKPAILLYVEKHSKD